MSDLLWEDVQVWFDPDLNGTLPDVHLPGTTVEDWPALLDIVRSEDWRFAYLIDGQERPPPAAAEDMLSLRDGRHPAQRLANRDILAIFPPYEAEQIDFDVDLRELQGQRQLDILCRFLTTIGRRLRKPVLMTPEGLRERSGARVRHDGRPGRPDGRRLAGRRTLAPRAARDVKVRGSGSEPRRGAGSGDRRMTIIDTPTAAHRRGRRSRPARRCRLA
ncbi:hypothetical protein Q3W71_20600 [Micromonospora sp. C28SCA-DRY-2]|uniref:hypothetical protein n=1 Tax=Micromonospora sp. C28SCA-DRY-2 TaxID=3059522 RepID=UPI002676BF0C|nr:hypothetical protein [Micromonospora sp. C28SCA-DRY-2]MDO3704067.1 hypothetical protein [Micromonospora sp. C28SCA-DRY-2]